MKINNSKIKTDSIIPLEKKIVADQRRREARFPPSLPHYSYFSVAYNIDYFTHVRRFVIFLINIVAAIDIVG